MVECSHLEESVLLNHDAISAVRPHQWACEVCRSRKSPWICLSCGAVLCGRYVNGHAKKHAEMNDGHCMCMDQGLTIYCYKDDDFVVNDNDVIQELRQHIQKQMESGHSQSRSSSRSPRLDEEEPPAPKIIKLQNGYKKPVRTAGLQNLGNTCFMNAILQSLSNLDQFCCYFKKLPSLKLKSQNLKHIHKYQTRCNTDPDECGTLVEEIRKISCALWENSGVLSPDSLFSVVWRLVPKFRGYQQQDAHEFMRYLLDKLHTELAEVDLSSTSSSSSSSSAMVMMAPKREESKKTTPTIVSEIFGGILQSDVTCLSCQFESRKLDPILDISLDIPERKKGEKCPPSSSIIDCLSYYTDLETLHETEWYYCSHCKRKEPSTKRLTLHTLPNVLCVHLKRFRFTSFIRTKLNTAVEFPLHGLDMSPFTIDYQGTRQPEAIYDLAAVVVHHGSGVSCGHYTTYAYSPKSESWYHFNDSTVTESNSDYVANSRAYILFYVKREHNSRYHNNHTHTSTPATTTGTTAKETLRKTPAVSQCSGVATSVGKPRDK